MATFDRPHTLEPKPPTVRYERQREASCRFLKRAPARSAGHGISVEGVMTDNG